MKKWYGGIITLSLLTVLLLRFIFIKDTTSLHQPYLPATTFLLNSTTKPLEWVRATVSQDVHSTSTSSETALPTPQTTPAEVIPADNLTFSLFPPRNITPHEEHHLLTWKHLRNLANHSLALPKALDATKEAVSAWSTLINSINHEKLTSPNGSPSTKPKEKQCPHYFNKMNATGLSVRSYTLPIPCGLTQGSSITIIGIPNGNLGNFRIDLTGEQIPGEPEPPIVLHYNVRIRGDKLTDEPVIVQNTWTAARDWYDEERCPLQDPGKTKKVDDLDQCNSMVGKVTNQTSRSGGSYTNGTSNTSPSLVHESKQYFPFRMGYPFVATFSVGTEGMQMTVDGKHITSFAFRETLEPWLVSEVRISGDLQLISVLASRLPTSEDLEHVMDLETLKSPPIPDIDKGLDLFVGVFSTANNFKRRMAVRRTWMQYPAVRSGAVAVRFFVGLHKNKRVNEELWKEAQAYRDIQLMPFVDYYSLITWKAIAICTFGTNVVSAKYVMKTDDDAFVRVDKILASLNRMNVTRGLLYGRINPSARPHRNTDSKWYISEEEWPEETYPPWAHGPGYVVSHDVAKEVSRGQQEGHLKMFKLEDVAMGIWIAGMKKEGLMRVRYKDEERIYIEGCSDGYIVAHYQSPRELLCLWQKLQDTKTATCCG